MFSYAIIGTGALGGFYGGLLARAGLDVHFLARSDFEYIQTNGLKVDSKWGDFRLANVNVYHRAAEVPACDVAVLATKSTSNPFVNQQFGELLERCKMVLVLQNGLGVESDIAHAAGAEKVLGGCCFLCSNKVAPGHIVHLDYGRIAMGEYQANAADIPGVSKRLEAIGEDFRAAGIPVDLESDLTQVRWQKLTWNIPYNGLSVVLNASTAEIMSDPYAEKLCRLLMEEVQQSAAACGKKIQDAFIEKMLDDTRVMVPYDSSMRLDFLNRRPMEVESIFGRPVTAAKSNGFRPARIEMLYQQLAFIDQRNCLDISVG